MFNFLQSLVLALVTFVTSVYTSIFRRIEDARTPVAIWDDPRLTGQLPAAADESR
ncbi:hypothetical protein ACH4VM_35585 [Streptomyces sp. NPDC020792]|uniref:hypothetical protein n=1 Tax=Streptomyces sp. NPDC020792 TaxID=3365089 RepID=UPI00379D25B8